MSGRRQRDRLSLVAHSLSERDQRIVTDVTTHGFLTAGQIARLHFAEVAHPGTRMRATQRTLRALIDIGLLARLSRPIGGVRAGSASFTYRGSAEGARLAAYLAGEGIPPVRNIREPGLSFVAHTVAVSEVWVSLIESARSGAHELLNYEPEPACWRTHLGPLGEPQHLRPDALASIGVGDYELRWFIDVDRGTEGSRALERKLRAYVDYYKSGREQRRDGVFPRVLWQLPTKRRQAVLDRLIGGLGEQQQALFVTTTPDQLLATLTRVPDEGGRT